MNNLSPVETFRSISDDILEQNHLLLDRLDAPGADGTRVNRPKRIRLRTVILNLMYVAAIDGNHGGRRYLRLGRNCHMAKTFIATYRRLAA